MKNIFRIFKQDLHNLMGNVIAGVVLVGLTIVPPLYAWFNILGFWDPFSNTDRIPVAVANEDEGYQSSLIPTRINAGSAIVSALHDNKSFDWEFVSAEEAIDGINSGRYYASIVIPKNFSADLMTVFSDHMDHATIDFYTNQKENAIAPRLTSEGASNLAIRVDETFMRTVTEVALGSVSDLTNFMNGDGIGSYATNLNGQLCEVIDDLDGAVGTGEALSALVGSTATLLNASSSALVSSESIGDQVGPFMDEAQTALEEAVAALSDTGSLIDQTIASAKNSFSSVDTAVNGALNAVQAVAGPAESTLESLSNEVGSLIQSYQDLEGILEQIQSSNPGSSTDINEALSSIQQAIKDLESLQSNIDQAIKDIQQGNEDLSDTRTQVQNALNEAQREIDGIHGTLGADLSEGLDQLIATLAEVKQALASITEELQAAAQSLAIASQSLATDLGGVQDSLEGATGVLRETRDSLASTQAELQTAIDSGNLEEVRRIIGSDPGRLAEIISAPTTVERHAVYPVANNGSAMAPFYTSLSIWIGSIFLIALMEVNVPEFRRKELSNPKPSQLYLGRYLIFLLIALIQATLVCLGDIFFVGIQCEHPFLFLLTGWAAALVFSNLIYTLVLSFGKVGEAIAVIGLVMQIAGSGGEFPVVMSAPIFQVIYPWLPFSHTMEAFQSCVAGIYGNTYWLSIGKLLLILIPSLLIGLALRRPIIKLYELTMSKLEETKMIL